jgi:hypothetical protein
MLHACSKQAVHTEFQPANFKGIDHLEDQSVDGKILKIIYGMDLI